MYRKIITRDHKMDKQVKGFLGILLVIIGIAIAGLGGTPGQTDSGISDNAIINVGFYVIGFFIAFLGFGMLLRVYRSRTPNISSE